MVAGVVRQAGDLLAAVAPPAPAAGGDLLA